MMLTDTERRVLDLYALLPREPIDFMQELRDEPDDVLKLLLQVLSAPGVYDDSEHPNLRINAIGASTVRRLLFMRRMEHKGS